MKLNLTVVYFLPVINAIVGLPRTENKISVCKKVKSPDGRYTTLCPAPKITRDEICNMQDTWIEITVDATLNEDVARKLQIVWHVPEVKPGDDITLYRTSPTAHIEPIFEVLPGATYGLSLTNVYETYIDISYKFQPVCLGYYVIYWRDSEVLAFSCLQTNPTWMKLYNFGQMKLQDMFIPGTHDSAAYHTAYSPQSVRRLDHYVFTQEDTILEQLVHGARALDLRVGRHGGFYFAHHGIVQLYPFHIVISDIVRFVKTTKEIVILDFHEFPIGFNDDRDHLEFVNYINFALGPYMVDPAHGWGTTLKEIWESGKYIIVSYNHIAIHKARGDILWPPITQMWGNVQNVASLYDYLDSTFERPPNGIWSAQAELTATAMSVVTHSLGGLRSMAQQANTQVSKWLRGRWGKQCHIVAMDFIRSSSIVDIAIEWNLRKSKGNLCKK